VVAIQVLRVPERGYSQSQLERNLLDWPVDVKTKVGENKAFTGTKV
jgi:hypothetical protein